MSEWISVKDRVPKNGTRCLAYMADPYYGRKVITLLLFDRGLWVYDGLAIHANVTHWMPLPEPPEEG